MGSWDIATAASTKTSGDRVLSCCHVVCVMEQFPRCTRRNQPSAPPLEHMRHEDTKLHGGMALDRGHQTEFPTVLNRVRKSLAPCRDIDLEPICQHVAVKVPRLRANRSSMQGRRRWLDPCWHFEGTRQMAWTRQTGRHPRGQGWVSSSPLPTTRTA